MAKPAPSKKDRRGVKRRRRQADALPDMLGMILLVPTRGDSMGHYFSALDRREHARRAAMRDLPSSPSRRVDAAYARRAAERIPVLCRCETHLISVSRSVLETGARPTCGFGCEAAAKRLANPLRICVHCLLMIEPCKVHHTPRELCNGWAHLTRNDDVRPHVCGSDGPSRYLLAEPLEET